MKLDTRAIRYLSSDDWRVLTAVEQGSRNHELVPTPLIQQIAGLRGGSGVHKCISNLAKVDLIARMKNAKYDGYRLTYGGIDYLALNSHRRSNAIFSLGNQIGVGKESDIYVTADPDGRRLVLKLHRLGRISFRTVKSNRDYLRKRSTGSWMYLSRLAAQKEHAFMKVLYREGFPVPEPVAWNRHTVVMEFIDSFPLRMVDSIPEPGLLYGELMEMIVKLAGRGLIHGDFNEFNILIKEKTVKSEDGQDKVEISPILIDFPQTISTDHANAEMYFDRDVACVKRYFQRRFGYTSDEPGPFLKDAIKNLNPDTRLDIEVEASGFSKKMAKELQQYVEHNEAEDADGDGTVEDDEESQERSDADGGADEAENMVEEDERCVDDSDTHGEELSEAMITPSFDSTSTQSTRPADFGLIPIEIPDAAPDPRLKVSKKAAGWAI